MAGTTPTEALATTLTKVAESRGISISELSRVTNIPRETLRRKLAGATEFFMGELFAVSAALDLDVVEVYGVYADARRAA